jgi:putative oxidoreductase
MKTLLRILRLEFLPASADLGLLLLRAWLGLTMLFNHGLEKLLKFSEQSAGFPDPLGVGSTVSLALAVFGEVVCAALLTLGLFGRFAALGLAVTMALAFFMVHQGALSGEGSGELAFIYWAGFLTLFATGPGNLSLDAMLAPRSVRRS